MFKKKREMKVGEFRKKFTLDEKRSIVQKIQSIKERSLYPEKVVKQFASENGYNERNLRRWCSVPELLEAQSADNPLHFRVSGAGRPKKVSKEQTIKFLDYVKEMDDKEEQLSYSTTQEWFQKECGLEMSQKDITKLMKENGLKYKAKSSKKKANIDPNEIVRFNLFVQKIRKEKVCVLVNVDEKPMRLLKIADKTITFKNNSHVAFENGGRSAKKTQTLVVGSLIVMKKGKIDYYDVCGCDVLLKSKSKTKVVPRAWTKMKSEIKNYDEQKKKLIKDTLVRQSKSGVMTSFSWPEFAENQMKIAKEKVLSKYPEMKLTWNFIPKVLLVDSAPGHSDRMGMDSVKKFWEKMKLKNWVEERVPKNGSDEYQPNDKGLNAMLDAKYRVLSDKWVKEKHETRGGKFQLPSQRKLLDFYIEMWTNVTKGIVKISWLSSGIPIDD